MADSVFPEDEGTGAPEGDFGDAANFASYGYHKLLSDYVISGFDVSVSNGLIDISSGMCAISDTSASMVQTSEERDQGVLYSVIADARSSISLNQSVEKNFIFLSVDLSQDDDVSIVVSDIDSKPSQTSLKLAEVDTMTDDVSLSNRTISSPNDFEVNGNLTISGTFFEGSNL